MIICLLLPQVSEGMFKAKICTLYSFWACWFESSSSGCCWTLYRGVFLGTLVSQQTLLALFCKLNLSESIDAHSCTSHWAAEKSLPSPHALRVFYTSVSKSSSFNNVSTPGLMRAQYKCQQPFLFKQRACCDCVGEVRLPASLERSQKIYVLAPSCIVHL